MAFVLFPVPHDVDGDCVKSARASPHYSPIQQTLNSPLRSCSALASGGARHRRAAAAARAGGRQPGRGLLLGGHRSGGMADLQSCATAAGQRGLQPARPAEGRQDNAADPPCKQAVEVRDDHRK